MEKKTRVKRLRDNSGGFTIIELLIAVSIIGVLSFSMYSLLSSKGESAKIAGAHKMTMDLFSSVEEVRVRTGALNYAAFQDMAYLESQLGTSNLSQDIVNPWGITPGFDISPASNNQKIRISILGVPTVTERTNLEAKFDAMGKNAWMAGGNVHVVLP